MTASASAASERRKEPASTRAKTVAASIAAKPVAKTPAKSTATAKLEAVAEVAAPERKAEPAPKASRAKAAPAKGGAAPADPVVVVATAEPAVAQPMPKREPAPKVAPTAKAEPVKPAVPAKLEPDAVATPPAEAVPAPKPSPPAGAVATQAVQTAAVLGVAEAAAAPPMPPPARAPELRPAEARPAERRPGPPGGPIVVPRAPAKAEVFQEGDHVVYPTHGVGKVERIVTEEIAGHRLELIHITFEENRMTLRVPVAKARTAGLRKLASRKLFDDALGVLKGKARIKRTMWSRRAQEYEAKINSGDPLAIAEVVRDLHRNAGQPDQSFSERQIYEAAMDRLAAELAALDKTDKPTAAQKLADFLKTV